MEFCDSSIAYDEFVNAPIFVTSVRQIASNDDRYFACLQFFHGDLKRIGLSCRSR
jgi:hypothetical protein